MYGADLYQYYDAENVDLDDLVSEVIQKNGPMYETAAALQEFESIEDICQDIWTHAEYYTIRDALAELAKDTGFEGRQ